MPSDEATSLCPNEEAIVARLMAFADANPQLRCLVLTDPALRKAEEEWEEIDPGIHERGIPLSIPDYLFPSHLRPCLYEIDPKQDPGLALLKSSVGIALDDWEPSMMELELGHRIGGWLWIDSAVPVETLARHLGRQLIQNDLAKNCRFLLRIFDPRVADVLWEILTREQKTQLFGPVRNWHFLDRGCVLRTLSNPTPSANPLSDVPRMHLNESQWTSLYYVGVVNRLLLRIVLDHHPVLPEGIALHALNAVQRGAAHGLINEYDLIQFAYLALTRHSRFDEHPAMQGLMQAIASGEEFLAALEHVHPEQWKRVMLDQPQRLIHF